MASITIAADHNTGAIPTRLTFSQEKAMSSARASQMALRGAIDLSQTARTMQMLAKR